jgi:hypothetical protein
MNRRNILSLSAMAALGLAVLPGSAVGQQNSLKDQLIGTWLVTSVQTTNQDGSKVLPFGPNPKGVAIFDATGHYIVFNTSSSLPKIATNNRMSGTADENKAIVQGSLSSYGTYSVDEAGKMILLHVEASTFPNWGGLDQKRPINSLTADELSYTNPAPTTGAGSTILGFKRAK